MSDQPIEKPTADIGRQQIGAVYAKAFLAAAEKEGTVAEQLAELQSLVRDVLDRFPEFNAILSSARISPSEKTELLDRAFGSRMSESVLRFLKVVCQHGRLDCLRYIAASAQKQHNEMRGVVEVRLTTAQAISNELSQRIERALAEHLGQAVELETMTDASLIGGMIVRVGDRVYDNSVRQRLASLRQQTVEKTVQEMRNATNRFAATD